MQHIFKILSTRYFSKGATPFWMVLVVDWIIVFASGLFGYSLLSPGIKDMTLLMKVVGTIVVCTVPYVLGFKVMRTYFGVIRYSSFIDLYRVAMANTIALVVLLLLENFAPFVFLVNVSWKSLVVSYLMTTAAMWAMRISIKYVYDIYFISTSAQKVFIYGVKEGGIALAKSIHSQESKYVVAGFVSDDQDDWLHLMMGAKIFPNDDRLVINMRAKGANILMVSPLKTDDVRNNQQMIDRLVSAGIKILLYAEHEWDGKSDLRQSRLKEVSIEDLLPRNQIEVDLTAIEKVLENKCVLITGAAGSIGSEIVRQVASFHPSQLVLIDQAETPLHDIRLMMARTFPDIPVLTLTASICHERHMEHVFSEYRPDYVFHAAAYKHVPMMEDNPSEAVANNIVGTRIMADLAVKYGVKKFVMVSTDKAVNPTNVMGCSKRICEMYCQSLNKAIMDGVVKGETQFVTTRFGNVLGSNGSVIPLFKEQIKNGGPLTVTHPDIIRYFMLIPEACKLVLQAGSMGNGGEIYVFDMGNPVRIADLAQRMILLSGARNVEIKYTGLREGEKLYEELLNKDENTKPSSHPKIKLATVRQLGYADVCSQIDKLMEITKTSFDDMAIVAQMKVLVPEFKSKNSKYEVLDR